MNTLNRQVNTGFNKQVDTKINLEVLQDTSYIGKKLKKGDTVTLSKNEAKAMLRTSPTFYRVKLD